MLQKEDAILLFKLYENSLNTCLSSLQMGSCPANLALLFSYFHKALISLQENNYELFISFQPDYVCSEMLQKVDEAKNLFKNLHDPLLFVQDFSHYYFLAQLYAYITDSQLSVQLNNLFTDLALHSEPKPISLAFNELHHTLDIKFPSKQTLVNFNQLLNNTLGLNVNEDLLMLSIPARLNNDHVVATFPNSETRELVRNTLGLTNTTCMELGGQDLIIYVPSCPTPEYLYRLETKKAADPSQSTLTVSQNKNGLFNSQLPTAKLSKHSKETFLGGLKRSLTDYKINF